MSVDGDPGWRPAWRIAGRRLLRRDVSDVRRTRGGMLTTMRVLFIAFAGGVALALLPIAFLHNPESASLSQSTGAWIVLAVAAVSIGGVLWLRQKPLAGDSLEQVLPALRSSYLRCVFLGVLPAVVGVFVSTATSHAGTYLIALLASAPGLFLSAPTSAELLRRQEQLSRIGSPVDLYGTLTGPIT